jgi:hypothetical protein
VLGTLQPLDQCGDIVVVDGKPGTELVRTDDERLDRRRIGVQAPSQRIVDDPPERAAGPSHLAIEPTANVIVEAQGRPVWHIMKTMLEAS